MFSSAYRRVNTDKNLEQLFPDKITDFSHTGLEKTGESRIPRAL
jgi:hypothetical protein